MQMLQTLLVQSISDKDIQPIRVEILKTEDHKAVEAYL
jgi:hypothetical protein